MSLAPIACGALEKLGAGLRRPEGVVVARDGGVWVSDQGGACAEVRPDGTVRRVGAVVGTTPNGIALDADGQLLIAGWGLHGAGAGPLLRLDPGTGQVATMCAEIDGRRLVGSNFPVVDRHGNLWCSHSTWDVEAARAGVADGFVYRVAPDGSVRVMAEGFHFANGIALDAGEDHLYVCQSVARNIVRCRIRRDGTLGPPEPYGPVLGTPAVPRAPADVRAGFGEPDGCGFDREGNLWVTLIFANRVAAITPAGAVETVIHDPDGEAMLWPTNVAWGGPGFGDLYVASLRTGWIVRAVSPVAGLPLPHQR